MQIAVFDMQGKNGSQDSTSSNICKAQAARRTAPWNKSTCKYMALFDLYTENFFNSCLVLSMGQNMLKNDF